MLLQISEQGSSVNMLKPQAASFDRMIQISKGFPDE